MKNQFFTGTPTSPRFALCPTTVKAGDAVLIDKLPAIALDDYNSQVGGTTFYMTGSFTLTVVARSTLSPAVNVALKPGQKVYADGGTLDSTTNVTTGFTIDGNTGATLFGYIDPNDPGLATGVTGTPTVQLAAVGA